MNWNLIGLDFVLIGLLIIWLFYKNDYKMPIKKDRRSDN